MQLCGKAPSVLGVCNTPARLEAVLPGAASLASSCVVGPRTCLSS